jgi:septum formation protein
MSYKSIILASASPRRAQLLSEAGYSFMVLPANIDEVTQDCPLDTVLENAKRKARTLSLKHPNSLIIAADTIVCLNDKILEKPHDHEEAKQMLQQLSGQSHSVYSAVSLQHSNENYSETFYEESRVSFKELNETIIKEYHSKVNPLDKAGSYNIDEYGELIVDSIEGSYSNIMGLPMETLNKKIEN